jgi:hypothetical protein
MRLFARRRNSFPAPSVNRARKLDIFIIDTGQNVAASELFRRTNLIDRLSSQHRIFVLSPQQSEQVIGKSEYLARRDPTLVMLNSDARIEKRPGTYGIHLCCGDLGASDAARFLELVVEIAGSAQQSGDQMIAELYQRTSSHAMTITRRVE